MAKLILVLILLAPSLASAQWTKEQKTIGAIALTALAVDYAQTRTIVNDPRWEEANPLLGDNPSMRKVNLYFVAVPIISYLALDALPSEKRTIALRIIAASELAIVGHNVHLGIKMSF